jgi:hypothetical protein
MLTITMLATLTAILTATITILCVMTQDQVFAPATATLSGAPPRITDATAETMPLSASCNVTLAGDWQTTELASLTQVTDMLDWLENHHVSTTELTSINGKFVIRWR